MTMPKTQFQDIRAICITALAFLLAACSSEAPDPAIGDVQESEAALTQGPSAPASARAKEQWRKSMLNVDKPADGCFKVSHPSTTWTAVPCVVAPNTPLVP